MTAGSGRGMFTVVPIALRFGHANHTTGNPTAGIASWLRPIVDLLVHNHATAQNRVLATEGQQIIFQFEMRFAGFIRFDITEIAGVPFGWIGGTVRFFHWIKMAAGRSSVRCGAIPEFMDMKGMFTRGKSGDVS